MGLSVYDMGTLSASVPRWIAIYAMAVAALFGLTWAVWRGTTFDKTDLLCVALLTWCAFSLVWGVDRQQGLYSLTNLASLTCVFLAMRHAPPRWVKYLPEAALFALIVGLACQYKWPFDWGGHGNRNFQTEFMLLALILGFSVTTRWGFALLAILTPVTILYLIFLNPSHIEFWVVACLTASLGFSAFWRRLSSRAGSTSFARRKGERAAGQLQHGGASTRGPTTG